MRDVGGRPVIRRRHHLDQLLLVRGEEGKRARRHRVECHTERPDIGALGLVLGLPPYFRCSVAEGRQHRRASVSRCGRRAARAATLPTRWRRSHRLTWVCRGCR
eukprot:scaffold293587_cov17-Tisochrysis_lutea.AAC.1